MSIHGLCGTVTEVTVSYVLKTYAEHSYIIIDAIVCQIYGTLNDVSFYVRSVYTKEPNTHTGVFVEPGFKYHRLQLRQK